MLGNYSRQFAVLCDATELLLKVALNIINQLTPNFQTKSSLTTDILDRKQTVQEISPQYCIQSHVIVLYDVYTVHSFIVKLLTYCLGVVIPGIKYTWNIDLR